MTRHDQIIQFKPEPYWLIQVELNISERTTLKLDHDRERIFDKDVALLIISRIKVELDEEGFR